MINVRWAEDDPNPGVKKRKAADTASVVEHRVHQKMAAATGVDPYGDDPALQARLEMLQGGGGGGGGGGDGGGGGGGAHAAVPVVDPNAYPDTDAQFQQQQQQQHGLSTAWAAPVGYSPPPPLTHTNYAGLLLKTTACDSSSQASTWLRVWRLRSQQHRRRARRVQGAAAALWLGSGSTTPLQTTMIRNEDFHSRSIRSIAAVDPPLALLAMT